MRILDDIISSLSESSAVRDSIVKEVHACVLWTAVISKNCGLASTFREEHPHHGMVRDAGELRGKPALELARYAKSDNLLEASIGMATINSLIDIDDTRCVKENALDVLVERGRNKNVAIVGHFPWLPQLREVVSKLWVIEQRPREGDLPEEAAEEILPQADVVGITGTSFTNHTVENLLKLCQGSFVVIIGPTSPLSPVLFDHGVDVIDGAKVVDVEKAIRCLSEGAMFRQIQGVELVNMKRG
jgi:uncharacterized protein (DUF4213/DUF364 family)